MRGVCGMQAISGDLEDTRRATAPREGLQRLNTRDVGAEPDRAAAAAVLVTHDVTHAMTHAVSNAVSVRTLGAGVECAGGDGCATARAVWWYCTEGASTVDGSDVGKHPAAGKGVARAWGSRSP